MSARSRESDLLLLLVGGAVLVFAVPWLLRQLGVAVARAPYAGASALLRWATGDEHATVGGKIYEVFHPIEHGELLRDCWYRTHVPIFADDGERHAVPACDVDQRTGQFTRAGKRYQLVTDEAGRRHAFPLA